MHNQHTHRQPHHTPSTSTAHSSSTRALVRLALLVALFTLAGAMPVGAKEFVPAYLVPSPERFQELRKAGLAEYKQLNQGYVLSFLRIEAMEGSKETTRLQSTVFALCEARYYPVLSGGHTLTDVTVTHVVLGGEGKPGADAKAHKVVHSTSKGVAPKSTELSAKEFHAALPPFAQAHLHLVTGTLSKRPYQPVVKYRMTEAEFAAEGASLVLDFVPAPGTLKKYAGETVSQIIETATKRGIGNTLRELSKSQEVRWGSANEISHAAVGDYAEAFKAEGAKLWNL